jgi:hypothetical protein
MNEPISILFSIDDLMEATEIRQLPGFSRFLKKEPRPAFFIDVGYGGRRHVRLQL